MTAAFFSGLGLCLALIVAPGAQNVYLLKMGIRRQHIVPLVVICFISDIALIALGVLGFGALMTSVPWLFQAIKWAGVVFLAGYALSAAWRAFRPKVETINIDEPVSPADVIPIGREAGTTLTRPVSTLTAKKTLLPAVLTVLSFTWLNPHAYLDTVVLLGSVATNFGADRWLFALGALTASAIWFTFIAAASSYAARWLSSPRSWRILDGAIAVLMGLLALGLALS